MARMGREEVDNAQTDTVPGLWVMEVMGAEEKQR